MRSAGALLLLALTLACGGSSAPASVSSPKATAVSGDPSCSPEIKQDLTFGGDLAGHVACPAGAQATCAQYHGATAHGLAVTIDLHAGSADARLFITPGINGYNGPASFTTGNVQTEAGISVGLDGFGHWISTPGGTFAVKSDDGRLIQGSVDVTIEGPGIAKAKVRGTWACLWVG
ncbi:MAG: hypothetical protein ABI838_01290 [Chloroflexota bacterium]